MSKTMTWKRFLMGAGKIFAVLAISYGALSVLAAWEEFRVHSPRTIGRALDRLIKSHPKREIREDFAALVAEDKVHIKVIHVRFTDEDKRTEIEIQKDGSLNLFIPENRLFEVRMDDISLDVTLWHEWQHITEFRDHIFPERIKIQEEYAQGKITSLTSEEEEEVFHDLYRSELRAYSGACDFVKELNALKHFEECLTREESGEEDFRFAIALKVAGRFPGTQNALAKFLRYAEEEQ